MKKIDAKENAGVIRIFTFSVTKEITNSGWNGAQTYCSLGRQISKNKCINSQTNQSISTNVLNS